MQCGNHIGCPAGYAEGHPRFHFSTAAEPTAQLAPFAESWRRPIATGANVAVYFVSPADRQLERHARVLDRQDWAKIARLRDPAARDQIRLTLIALRLALSQAVGGTVAPDAWSFETNSYGKPRLARHLPDVAFCISHTDTLSVIAVSRDVPVGVDIEKVGPAPADAVVESFCSRRERKALARLDERERGHAFTRLWTLKEAYAKLVGTGLAADFTTLEFEIGPERQVMHRASRPCAEAAVFESWLCQASAGLCQVSVAIGRSRDAYRGELVCLAADAAGTGRAGSPLADTGHGVALRLS